MLSGGALRADLQVLLQSELYLSHSTRPSRSPLALEGQEMEMK